MAELTSGHAALLHHDPRLDLDRGEQDGLTSDEQARLRELERENARLRMERELLKRTVAFWVTEQSTP